MKSIWRALIAGMVGSLAMVPFGILLRATGHRVNVYGELLIQTLLGHPSPVAMFVQHLAIGGASAVPLAFLLRRTRAAPLPLGLAYGAAMWVAVNSFALPLAFGRATPWQLGWEAIWPSLLVHLVYGIATALFIARGPASLSVEHSAHHAAEEEIQS